MEKAMAPHSSTLAWKTPWTEEPGGLHGVTKSQARLSNFTFTFHFHALEKEMATHSSVLAWRIPGMAEPGGLPSMGSCRVGHDWSDLAAAAAMKKINELCSIQCYPRYYQKDRRNYNCCHCLFVNKLDCYSWWRGSGTESSKHDLEENSESHSGGIF